MEVFQKRRGIGSRLLDFVKSQGYELIELEANPGDPVSDPVNFFSANQFVDTGIVADGDQKVMVWNNPTYTEED